MVLGYDGVKRALHDQQAFSSRASFSGGSPLDWLVFLDPPRHTQLRALIGRAFTPRVIADLEPRIRELVRGLLAPVRSRGEMDFCADFSVQLPMLVIAELLGIPSTDRDRFHRWGEAILDLSESLGGGEAAQRASAVYRVATLEMGEYLSELLPRRRAQRRNDLLTNLALAEADGERLTSSEILDFFQLLLVAGTETTTNLLGNALLCFIEHPEALAQLHAAPELLPSAIEEALRYRSPAQAMFRETRHDVELDGQVIPRGKLVLTLIGSANRDPQRFQDADRFDITRDPNPHLAFGHGIHFCLGAPLSRLEARVALSELLACAQGFTLTENKPWEPRRAFHIHGPARLPIRFEPRTSGDSVRSS